MRSEDATAERMVVRNLPDGTKALLCSRARRSHSSTEAEAREILVGALAHEREGARPMAQHLAFAERFREEFGGIDLEYPSFPGDEPRDPFA